MADATTVTPVGEKLQAALSGLFAPFVFLASYVPKGWMKWIALTIMLAILTFAGLYLVQNYLFFHIPTWTSGEVASHPNTPLPKPVAEKPVPQAKVITMVTMDKFEDLESRVRALESRQTVKPAKKPKALKDPKDD